jgi:hypothetical protein
VYYGGDVTELGVAWTKLLSRVPATAASAKR